MNLENPENLANPSNPSNLLNNVVLFGRLLRRAGIDVHAARLAELAEALSWVDLGVRHDVYHAFRALLVTRQDQFAVFDAAFMAFWRDPMDRASAGSPASARADRARVEVVEVERILAPETDAEVRSSEDEPSGRHDASDERGVKTWSRRGGLAQKDFADFTAEELRAARIALSRLVWNPGERRTRRWVHGRGSRIDLRRALARSLRTGGDVVTLPRLARRRRPRTLVLLCDVSGSMEDYSRMLLHFAHTLTRRHGRVETFLFATRLTRVTKELRAAGPDEALAAVARAVADWSGGTRIGDSIRTFHQQWGRRVLHGGPVVLLVSDGWDRGDPMELAGEIARLQRSCHRLIWLNPLIGTMDYEPLTRGLKAALPFVDDFLPARTLTNLADLAAHLNRLGN